MTTGTFPIIFCPPKSPNADRPIAPAIEYAAFEIWYWPNTQALSYYDGIKPDMISIRSENNPPRSRKTAVMLVCLLASYFRALVCFAEVDQFQDLSRTPDAVSVVTETGGMELLPDAHGVWRGGNITVTTERHHGGLAVELAAPDVAVKNLQLSWKAAPAPDWKYLGDAWERAYGDLEWRPLDGRRVMPWYFLATTGKLTHGYGVKTGPAALCHWTVDTNRITLHADVRCGGSGVQLGRRK